MVSHCGCRQANIHSARLLARASFRWSLHAAFRVNEIISFCQSVTTVRFRESFWESLCPVSKDLEPSLLGENEENASKRR